jgi:O-antigen ligase
MPNSIFNYTTENRGRVLLLFLLFLLAIYELATAGFSNFAIICISPIVLLFIIAVFKWRMMAFWLLIIANWFIQFKNMNWHMPLSLVDEMLELLLIGVAIIDARKLPHFDRTLNVMLLSIMVWCGLCCIEVLNDTCGLGINFNAWFTGARLMALQLIWIILVFTLYIDSPKVLLTYLRVWAVLSLFSAFWTWKMINYGFTAKETGWLYGVGYVTHILNGGTLYRYWSTFSDAANYGCNAGASAVAFLVFGITTKLKRDKIFFLITAAVVTWGMFQSGTRTAMFAMIAGFMVFLVVSKSIRILVPSAIIGAFFLMILMFTNIGNSNQQMRRMRSAFKKDEDASAKVRDINQAAIAKYMKDAPWGIGIGVFSEDIPAWNKYKKLSEIPPDSEYVFIWVRTGPVGVTVFACCMMLMLGGACCVVLFRLKNPSLIGIGGGMCSAFAAIQLAGYANQVIYQYPNGLTFFGGIAIVYLLPYIEPEWEEYEKKRIAQIEDKKRLKLEKKLASRV